MRYGNPHNPYSNQHIDQQGQNPMNPTAQQLQMNMLRMLQAQQAQQAQQFVPNINQNQPNMQQMMAMMMQMLAQQGQVGSVNQVNQPIRDDRFGGGTQTLPNITQRVDAEALGGQVNDVSGDRFGAPNPTVNKPMTQQTTTTVSQSPVLTSTIKSFKVTAEPVKFPGNTKFKLTPIQTRCRDDLFVFSEEVIYVSSIEAAVDQAIEISSKQEDSKLFQVLDVVIGNDTLKLPNQVEYRKLYSGDVRNFYKTLKLLYSDANSVDEISIAERINRNMTELVNHYLLINFDGDLAIDSFITDFNDLLRVLRNNFSDVEAEDDLLDHLLSLIEASGEALTEDSQELIFIDRLPAKVVYFADHSARAGLAKVDEVVRIEKDDANLFLTSVCDVLFDADSDRNTFYFVTYDLKIYLFSRNNNKQLFVELVDVL